MSDIPKLPTMKSECSVTYFYGTDDPGSLLRTYDVPSWAGMLFIIAVGSGSGGGTGGGAAGNQGGGGGGGAGAVTRVMLPTAFLPNKLYVSASRGRGATNAGSPSYVSIAEKSTATANLVCTSGNAASTAGASASGATGGSPGVGETPASETSAMLMAMGPFNSLSGQDGVAGANGGANNGTASVLFVLSPFAGGPGGGGGGGGSNGAGGDVTGAGLIPTISGSATSGAHGSSGFAFMKPFLQSPGAGGSGGSTGAAGNSGTCGIGCGGGGGGGGTVAGVMSGVSGAGLVVIIAW